MIVGFRQHGAEDLFHGADTGAARRTLPIHLWKIAARKFALLNGAAALYDLRIPTANRLETLKGERRGQHSIRINGQYRICFSWTSDGPDEVEVTDYH